MKFKADVIRNPQLEEEIRDFFRSNPYPDDDDIHDLADGKGISPHEFEELIYTVLTEILPPKGSLIPKGKTNLPDINEVNPDELAMGIEVEKEHTDREDIATEMALAHLKEIPDYYTKLKAMEESSGVTSAEKFVDKNGNLVQLKNCIRITDSVDSDFGRVIYLNPSKNYTVFEDGKLKAMYLDKQGKTVLGIFNSGGDFEVVKDSVIKEAKDFIKDLRQGYINFLVKNTKGEVFPIKNYTVVKNMKVDKQYVDLESNISLAMDWVVGAILNKKLIKGLED